MKIKTPACPFKEILLVRWHDASSSGIQGEWETYADLKCKPSINYSVGFHLEEKSTDDVLVLCLNTTTDTPIDVAEVMQIPRGMVQKVTRLYARKTTRPKPTPFV